MLVAWRRGTWLDNLLPATTFLQAAPYFFVAFLALQLFSATLGWFPSVGAYSQAAEFPGWNLTYIADVAAPRGAAGADHRGLLGRRAGSSAPAT